MAEFNETLEVAVNDGLSVSFYKGLRANLPVVGVDGVYYQCTDTGELFLGTGTGMKQVTKEIDLTDYATKEDLQNVPHAETATDLTGRVEATPEVFTYRPSAGDKSIKDDNAFIRRVKGNSIVYGAGQILKEINSDNWEQYSASYTDISFGDNECTLTVNSGYTGGNIYQLGLKYKVAGQKYLANHTYLAIFEVYLEYSGQAVIEVTGTSHPTNKAEAGKWVEVYTTFTPTADKNTFYIKPPFGYQTKEAVGKSYSVRNAMLFDLTSLYEVEPTFEEFRIEYPDAYYPVGGGELRNLVCWGIKTVGFNQFNGTYAKVLPNESYYFGGTYTSIGFATEVGGTTTALTIPNNRLYTPTSEGYIYATGTDICINLHHTGYRDGEYEPYREVTHELPLSQITNGEPLRMAGSGVFDEINETHYIQRVGVRPARTSDKDDTTLLTDGTTTNYPLASPIVTPINTFISFNYYVEDFGTEEALLAEDSAPFSADIIYQFNAVDRIRQNDLNIDRLEETIYNLDQSITGKVERAEYFPISLESLYAVAEGETVSANKYSIKEMLYRQQEGLNDLLLQSDEGLTVGYVVGGVVGDSLHFSAYTNDGKLIKVVTTVDEYELIQSEVQVFDLLSSGEPNSQLAYAEYTGTATAAVVTTKYGYFPTTLVEGASVAVKFEGSLTYITTLNVNGTGAKNVYYKGNSLASGTISRYSTYIFVYDGSYYRIVGIDTDTHYTAKNVVTSSSTSKSNATATNGNVYLNAVENSTVRSTHKIVGTGATSVTSDSSGNITIDTPIKTINGESIVGSGDITISGGSSSGSAEVYLTPFTVEQFCTGYVELTDEQLNELLNVASQNRIIGMPYNGTQTGYMVADYKYQYDLSLDFWSLSLGVIYNGAHYTNSISSSGSIYFTPSRITIAPFKPIMYIVTAEDGVAYVSDDLGFTDNCVCFVDGECSEVYVYIDPSEIGKTVRFFTGESCTLEIFYPVYWANGEVPTIEPYTHYELSLVANMEGVFNGVLTPFKPVE